jgi:hypothetical protein
MTDRVLTDLRPMQRRPITLPIVLAALLTVVIAALVIRVWRSDNQRVAQIGDERQGVAYLRTLPPLLTALTTAQSQAVAGQPVSFDALDRAAQAVETTDRRLGPALRTEVIWASARTRLQQLHTRTLAVPADAYEAFHEVAALILDLYDKVRSASGLIRDPDASTFFLEDAVAHELPASVVAASQYADLTVVATSEPDLARPGTTNDMLGARAALLDSTQALGGDISDAIDNADGQTLSDSLLRDLDQFRLSVEALTPVASLTVGGGTGSASPDKSAATAAAATLATAILAAIDGQLDHGLATTRRDRAFAIAGGLVALLLIAALITVIAVPRRRRSARRPFGGPVAVPEDLPGTQEAGATAVPSTALVTRSVGSMPGHLGFSAPDGQHVPGQPAPVAGIPVAGMAPFPIRPPVVMPATEAPAGPASSASEPARPAQVAVTAPTGKPGRKGKRRRDRRVTDVSPTWTAGLPAARDITDPGLEKSPFAAVAGSSALDQFIVDRPSWTLGGPSGRGGPTSPDRRPAAAAPIRHDGSALAPARDTLSRRAAAREKALREAASREGATRDAAIRAAAERETAWRNTIGPDQAGDAPAHGVTHHAMPGPAADFDYWERSGAPQ